MASDPKEGGMSATSDVFWDGSFNGAEFMLNPTEREVVRLFNVERKKLGIPPVFDWNTGKGGTDALQMIGTWMAKDMAVKGYISHTDSLGRTPGQRWKLGYDVNGYVGEILAFGYTTPALVVAGWMNSPGHRDIIINPVYKYVGMALSLTKPDQWRYWAAEFGSKPLRLVD